MADYFEQQGPRPDDVIWAGDGGNYPNNGMGKHNPPRVRTAPHSTSKMKKSKSSVITTGGGQGKGGGGTITTSDSSMLQDDFTPQQQQSPYWSPKITKPRYTASRISTAEPSTRRRQNTFSNSQQEHHDQNQNQNYEENEDDYDTRRQYLTTPDLNTIRLDYSQREQLKDMLSASVDHLTGDDDESALSPKGTNFNSEYFLSEGERASRIWKAL